MHTLLYISTATSPYSKDDIMDILNISRQFNSRNDITGLLLYHEGSILQVLEGEKEVIEDLFYNKICLDKRHHGIIELLNHEIKERSFEDWSMGFKQISTQDWAELKGHIDISNIEEFSKAINSASDDIITMIKSYSDVNQLRM